MRFWRSAVVAAATAAVLVVLPALPRGSQPGASAADLHGRGTTLALPLIGEPPEWYTEEVLLRTLEAAERGLGYDFASGRTVEPAAAPSQVLIRPGTQILPESIYPGWCTAAFVFDNRSKIATAGHCTLEGDRVIALSAPSTLFVMGTTTKSTGDDSRVGDDWALITIDAAWRPYTDPTTALVAGPCGQTASPDPPILKYVGHGTGIGTGGTARAGLFDDRKLNEELHDPSPGLAAVGLAMPGDSGAPVLETTRTGASCAAGAAVGVLTHVGVFVVAGEPLVPTGFFFGTPLSKIRASLDNARLLP